MAIGAESAFCFPDQERVSSWLLRVLRREEEKWSGASTPEVLGDDYFCPLAVDVIQVTAALPRRPGFGICICFPSR